MTNQLICCVHGALCSHRSASGLLSHSSSTRTRYRSSSLRSPPWCLPAPSPHALKPPLWDRWETVPPHSLPQTLPYSNVLKKLMFDYKTTEQISWWSYIFVIITWLMPQPPQLGLKTNPPPIQEKPQKTNKKPPPAKEELLKMTVGNKKKIYTFHCFQSITAAIYRK